MIFDLVYLLLLLTGILILIENRLKRIITLVGLQGLLLCIPVFQFFPPTAANHYHAYILVGFILLFKTILTPFALLWSLRHGKLYQDTNPRFGYLASLFLFLIGLIVALLITNSMTEIPHNVDKIALIYVMLIIYLGVLAFIIRRHWIALSSGFIMLENGIFLLALILNNGLPLGVEFGAFVDALLVIVSAVTLQIRKEFVKNI